MKTTRKSKVQKNHRQEAGERRVGKEKEDAGQEEERVIKINLKVELERDTENL